MADHPDQTVVERFALGEATPEEGRQVLDHLLAGCPVCRNTARTVLRTLDLEDEPELQPEPDAAFDRILAMVREREAMLAVERAQAVELLEELERHPLPRQLTLIRNSTKYSTWALCESLIEIVKDAGSDDPRLGVERAEAAVAVAGRMDPERYGERLVTDMRARAWSYLGNSRRVRGALREAEEALELALEQLEQGTGDPLEEGIVFAHWGSLRAAQRRVADSVRWYDRAIRTYRTIGETQKAARVMVAKANSLYNDGQLARGIRILREGLRQVDPKLEPRLHLIAQFNLALYLQEAGRLDQAKRILARVRPGLERLGERMNLLRLRWLDGKIAHAEGRLEDAEEILKGVRAGFLESDPYPAAFVSLDLAVVLAERGRTREVRDLATEMVAVFRSRRIHREAIAALIVFARAARQERITAELQHEITRFLERVQRDPTVKFRES